MDFGHNQMQQSLLSGGTMEIRRLPLWTPQAHINELIKQSILFLRGLSNKKALLSQRRPRDAPNIWVP